MTRVAWCRSSRGTGGPGDVEVQLGGEGGKDVAAQLVAEGLVGGLGLGAALGLHLRLCLRFGGLALQELDLVRVLLRWGKRVHESKGQLLRRWQ